MVMSRDLVGYLEGVIKDKDIEIKEMYRSLKHLQEANHYVSKSNGKLERQLLNQETLIGTCEVCKLKSVSFLKAPTFAKDIHDV